MTTTCSSECRPRSLFFSRDIRTPRALYPDRVILHELLHARLVVSEPIRDLPDACHEVPEASYGIVGPRDDKLLPSSYDS
jgi:hypothetical protein